MEEQRPNALRRGFAAVDWYGMSNYLFILPAVALFLTFNVYPYFKVFQLSFYEWNGISGLPQFVGLANFHDIIFDNAAWWQSVRNVVYITVLALTFQNGLALLLAWLVDQDVRR